MNLSEVLEGFKLYDIDNIDETALLCKCMSDKTLALKNEKSNGGKYSKIQRKTHTITGCKSDLYGYTETLINW